MIFFILLGLSLYFILLLLLIAGWHKAITSATGNNTNISKNLLTVVIPFRNEEANIAALIESLLIQSNRDFEVLLVDDHSEDGSADLVRKLIQGQQRYRLLTNNGVGKKKAITTGVSAAKGSIIVTTDADCVAPEGWIERIDQAFTDESVKLLFGPVHFQRSNGNFFSELQALEFMTVVATGAAAFQLGQPIYCNGANLAFRRDVFQALNGYDGNFHVPSGDDEFLLRKVIAANPQGVKWLGSTDAIIQTTAQPGISEFLHQRVRWAGKWKYASASAKVLAGMMLMVQVIAISAGVMLVNGVAPKALGLALLAKFSLEYVFLFTIGHFFKHPVKIVSFITLQLLYPFYVIGVGILSNFVSFRWKGRRLRTTESATGHF